MPKSSLFRSGPSSAFPQLFAGRKINGAAWPSSAERSLAGLPVRFLLSKTPYRLVPRSMVDEESTPDRTLSFPLTGGSACCKQRSADVNNHPNPFGISSSSFEAFKYRLVNRLVRPFVCR